MDKQQIVEGEMLTPIPREQGESITMDFPDAIREVVSGKKVTRIEWANTDYGFVKDEWLTISRDGKFHTWLISQGDMDANDWIVVIDATKN
jgi:hypothetical protein